MQPAFPARQVANLMLTAALVWLHFAGGWGLLPVIPQPGKISVLLVEEVDDAQKPEYRPYELVLNSSKVLAYLNSHCEKVGSTPEWRRFDQNADVSNESPKWQNAMKKPRQSLPWLYVTNGIQSWGGPLPKTEDETLALLAKWGGQ